MFHRTALILFLSNLFSINGYDIDNLSEKVNILVETFMPVLPLNVDWIGSSKEQNIQLFRNLSIFDITTAKSKHNTIFAIIISENQTILDDYMKLINIQIHQNILFLNKHSGQTYESYIINGFKIEKLLGTIINSSFHKQEDIEISIERRRKNLHGLMLKGKDFD